jgi:site-specific recombinase XerD
MNFNTLNQSNPNALVPVTHGSELAAQENATLSAVIKDYLANFLSDRTREAYEGDFRDFGKFISKTFGPVSHPRDITKTQVIAYRDFLREKYSPTSINRKMSALSSLFYELQGARLVDINPVEGVKRPQSIARRPRLGFTDDEVNRILESHNPTTLQGLSTKAILSFLLYTGCRISEALAVRVSDIEDRGNLKVVIIRGKGDKIRTLPLHPKLLKVVLELIERRSKTPSDYLFTRLKGHGFDNEPMRRQSVGELLKATLRRLQLDTGRSLHSSRRTVISNLLENGARIESVATLAGHANINTTQRYNVRQEDIEDNPLLTLRYQD